MHRLLWTTVHASTHRLVRRVELCHALNTQARRWCCDDESETVTSASLDTSTGTSRAASPGQIERERHPESSKYVRWRMNIECSGVR